MQGGYDFKFGIQLEAYLAGALVALQKAGKTGAAELLREVWLIRNEGRC